MALSTMYDMTSDQARFVFPTSFNQERMWFLYQLEPGSATYNVLAAVHLSGRLDVEILHRGLNAIVQRHEALRTTFRMLEDQPVQVIAPSLVIPLPVVDLRSLPEAEREAEALRLANEEVRCPFDLTRGPLVRAALLHVGTEEYLLVLTIHHIVFDGWSRGVLYRELVTLYEAFSAGQPSPLQELPIKYADFALWQREALQGDGLAEHLAYWKQHLQGAPAGIDLPTDRPRPPVLTSRGATYWVTLPGVLTDALKELSRQEGVSLHTILVAAFQTLLYRYSGQDDVVIGNVRAGRTQAETRALIGFFVNTLVLRTDLSGNPTFRALLKRVRDVVLEAKEHEELPFETLVKELQPERQLGQNPLFQVMLNLLPTRPILPSGWTSMHKEVETGTSKFDLTLELENRAEGLVSHFEYRTDLFDEATIARMAGHWQTLLEGIVANPERHLSELPFLTEVERQQLLVEWNATQTAYPKDQCVHQLFEEQVERTPEAAAVVFEHEQLTYRELNRRANQLAHHLRNLGVGPDVLVGICVERSLDMVVGLLGILKAGGAYVPLDPGYPEERLAFLLADTQAPVLLTQQHLVDRLPEHHPQLLCLDTDWQTISRQSEANPVNEVKGKQLAYVIYTSGSTGQPKGVLIEHQAIAAHCWAITQVYELRAEDCVLQFSTFTFDASLEQILPTLLVGARLVVRGQEIWSPTDLLHKVKDLGLTVINLPPAYWNHVLQEWVQAPQCLLGHRLRLVIVGGDRLLPEMLQLWRQTPLRSVRLLNAYGPTETTITATIFDITHHLDQEHLLENVPIGHPLPNRRIYILDRAGNPVPVGVAGELYIGGGLLARGYLNRPELTAERFIADPFSQQPQARLYKTGDLTRFLPDGTVEFLGRVDQQVKIRGFRIELDEIEAVLSQHPDVREAVVSVREDTPGERYLVAYVVVKGQTVGSRPLRSYLKQKLPEYMIPAAFVQLESLPLMSNGKVNRRSLPAPQSASRTEEEGTFLAPTLPVHYQLIKIWEELLVARPIGIRDNFFYLGGHSLLAARLVARIEQVFGKRIPLATLFGGPTIEQLANALQQQGDTDHHAPLVTVQAGGSKRPFFFLHGDYEGGAFYCFALARGLGTDRPFYALEPCKLDDLQAPPTIEAMATAHIKLVRTIQPKGPYLLGGFCNGGLVAYEMARQLHVEGETVDLLVLMNPTPVGYLRFLRTVINHFGNLIQLGQHKQLASFLWLRHMYRYVQHLYRYMRFHRYRRLQTELEPEQASQNGGVILTLKALHELWLSYGAEHSETNEQMELGPRSDKMRPALASPRFDAVFPDPIFPTVEVLRHDWGGLFHWTASDYVPGFYPGKCTFFFSWDWHSQKPLPWSKKWRKVAEAKDKEVEVHTIPGTHDTCKTEYLHDLTERLRMCLDKVQVAESE